MLAFAVHTNPVCLLLASAVSFLFLLPAAPVGAQTVWNGNIDTDWFTAGNWSTNVVPISSTDVDISSAITALINAPGAVSLNASIGLSAGSSGMVDVSGGDWTNSGNLIVGDSGTGVLSLSSGTLSNTGSSAEFAAYLGFNTGSSGTVNVSGGTWDNNNRLWVGYSGAGVLNISGTAAVTNFACVLGNFAGSSGTANVTGGTWETTGVFVVGQLGTGELNISGGQVTHRLSAVTVGASASGTVNVSGGTWTPPSLSIGISSTGTLNISGTGVVSSISGDAFLGINSGEGVSPRGSGTATISGGTWTHRIIYVGQGGDGQLTISGGSVLSSAVHLGENNLAIGTATVSGGTWTVNNEFIVGNFNLSTGVLNLSGTGVVNVAGGIGNTTLGFYAGSSGTANVSGGTWANHGLFVGSNGTGELNISGTGAVSSEGGTLGQNAGGSGTANVSGGTWTISGILSVGNNGTGVLNLSGGAVSSNTGILGGTVGGSASASGTVNVSGGTWTNSSTLIVGSSGAGALNLSGTGVVSAGAGGGGTVLLAQSAGSNGTLNFGDGTDAPGTLLAAQVNGGAGTAKVNFNHTSSAHSVTSQLTGSLAVEVMQGTTIFTAANTYTGGTTVSGGTLAVTGSLAGVVDVSRTGPLANAPVLSGHGDLSTTGLISGAVTLGGAGASGILNPGAPANDIGSLKIGSVTVLGGSQLQFHLSQPTTTLNTSDMNTLTTALASGTFTGVATLLGANLAAYDNTAPAADLHDYLQLTGTLTVDAGSAVPIFKLVDSAGMPYTTGTPKVGDVFNLIDWLALTIDNGTDFTALNFDLPSLGVGSDLRFDYSGFKDYGLVVVVAVPEPSRAVLLMLGLTALFPRRRRRAV